MVVRRDDPEKTERRASVRRRAARHLRRLALAGSATGAAVQLACCTTVCDPLPPPIECSQNPSSWTFVNRAYPDADWRLDGDTWVIDVIVSFSLNSDDDPVGVSGPPEVLDATLLDHTINNGSLSFTCQPTGEASEIEVTVPLDCDGTVESMRFEMDISGTPRVGRFIPVQSLSD